MSVKNIIFDLGGIFIDIDFHKTRNAFVQAGIGDFDNYYHQSFSNPLFAKLEKGLISPDEFYQGFRESAGVTLSDDDIKNAWNALLGRFRPASVGILPMVKIRYKTFLLSNTNQVHHDAFMNIYEQQFGVANFDSLFHKAYYSHQIAKRKPDAESYLHIVEAHGLNAGETLFVDDTYKNIEGAEVLGLQTLWLEPGMVLEEALLDRLSLADEQ